MDEAEECPVCKEKSVIIDEEHGQKVRVCTECGAMDADMQDLTHEGHPEGTTLTDGKARGPDGMRYRTSPEDSEFGGQIEGRKFIRVLGSTLHLSRDIINDAIKLFERVYFEDVRCAKDVRRNPMCLACLYAIAKQNNHWVEIKGIVKHLSIMNPYRRFGQSLTILREKYNVQIPRNSFAEDCHRLLLDKSFTMDEIRMVQQLLLLLRRAWLCDGRYSKRLVYHAAYYVWKASNYAKPGVGRLSYLNFCKKFDVGRNQHLKNEMDSVLQAMAKELPWLTDAKKGKDDVAIHLQDIIKYQNVLFDSAVQTTLTNLRQENNKTENNEEDLEDKKETVFQRPKEKRNAPNRDNDIFNEFESLPKKSKCDGENQTEKTAAADDDADDLDLGSDDDTSQYIRTAAEVKQLQYLYKDLE